MTNFTEERREFLEALAERIDDQAKRQSEYLTENHDVPNDTFDCLDELISTGNLRGEHETEAETLFKVAKKLWGKDWQNEVRDCCRLKLTGIYINDWEVASYTLGECEEQLDDETMEELSKLTVEEFEYLGKTVRECYLSKNGLIYLSHNYDRWVLILDPEILIERIAEENK